MKKKIFAVIAAVVLIIGMLGVYQTFREKPVEGSKEITIEVVDKSGEISEYETQTDAEYLFGAMQETKDLEFEYYEGDYGPVITSVNGEKADFETDGAYWSILVNGEYGNYGVGEQPVEDGDVFQIAYTIM